VVHGFAPPGTGRLRGAAVERDVIQRRHRVSGIGRTGRVATLRSLRAPVTLSALLSRIALRCLGRPVSALLVRVTLLGLVAPSGLLALLSPRGLSGGGLMFRASVGRR
jgi:hypothetical protein